MHSHLHHNSIFFFLNNNYNDYTTSLYNYYNYGNISQAFFFFCKLEIEIKSHEYLSIIFDNRRRYVCKWFPPKSISLLETRSSSLSISRQNYIVPEIFLKVPDSASAAFKASRSKFDNSPEGRHSKYIRNNLSRCTELADEC